MTTKSFQTALSKEKPLQIVGVINAYCAKLAENAGFQAIYLSGSGVAAASYGLPDLGITNLNDVLEDIRRITYATDLPLLVDVDTGFGSAFGIARTVKELNRAGAAALHIEDQVTNKRCGHRPNKELVTPQEMIDRIKAAVDANSNSDFMIMARTDALASEGLEAAIDRAKQYVEAGATAIFAEALQTLEQYQRFTKELQVPILANLTEFGKTPLFTRDELAACGVQMLLYPLSAFRAMSQAANHVYQTIKSQGTQQPALSSMQTREELYKILNYYAFEEKLDQLFS